MNKLLKSALLAVLGAVLAVAPAAAQTNPDTLAKQKQLFRAAEADLAAGKYAAAEVKAKALIRARPGDPYPRRLLANIHTSRREAASLSHWEAAMKKMVIADLNIDDASLEEVIDYVTRKAKALSAGKTAPSFIFKSPETRDRSVTLQLKNVPLTEVLRYAGELADVRYSFERFAIVVHDTADGDPAVAETPRSEPAPAPEPEPAPTVEPEGFPSVLGFESPVVARDLDVFSPQRR